jgi:hypothetical protein
MFYKKKIKNKNKLNEIKAKPPPPPSTNNQKRVKFYLVLEYELLLVTFSYCWWDGGMVGWWAKAKPPSHQPTTGVF